VWVESGKSGSAGGQRDLRDFLSYALAGVLDDL
jgi:hypothetical protein